MSAPAAFVRRLARPLGFFCASAFLWPAGLRAADGAWGSAILGGAATWNDPASWSGATVADGVGAVATFTQDFSANLQFTFSSATTVGEIRVTDTSTTNPDRGVWFNAGTLVFATASGTPSITITADTSGGNHDIPLRFNGATIQGAQGLIINLEGANYNGLSAGARFSAGDWSGFSGPVTLQTGRYRVEAANNTLPPNSEIILGPGVWFQIVRGYSGGLGSQSIRGLSGGDATTLAGAENSANDTAASGTLTLGATALATDSYAFSGVLGGDMFGTGTPNTNFSVTKTGPGTQRLNGNSLYTGTTTVSGGTLLVNGTHTQGAGANAGRYLVTAGGTLGGNGTILLSDASAGTTGLSLAGVLSPGDPAVNNGLGTLTVNGTNSARGLAAFEGGGSFAIDLGAANSADRLAFTGASAGEIFFNNNVINFHDLTGGGLSGGQYVLIGADVAGAFNTGDYSSLRLDASGYVTAGLSIGSGLGGYPGSTLQVVGNNLVLNLVVPAGPPPAAPAGLTVTNGFDQVTLAWSAVSGAGSYTVRRSTTAGSGYVDIASGVTGTTYADATATPGVTYYYIVVAVNGNGQSAASPQGSGVSTIRAAIGLNLRAYNTYGLPVTDLAGAVRKAWWNNLVGPAVTGQSATLAGLVDYLGNPLAGMSATFTAGATGGGYNGSGTVRLGSDAVTVGPAANDLNLYSSVFDQYNGTPSSLAVSGIPYGSYDFVVYVYDGGSARGGYVTVNGVNLAVRGGAGNPTADGTGYVRSTDSVNLSGSSVQQGNYVRFTGLSGATLTATFTAANLGDSTQRLKIAGFQILSNDANPAPTVVPAAPASLTASSGDRQVGLNWSPAATATGYRVYRAGTLLATVNAPATAYADTTAVNGTAYSYTVSAVNAVGEGIVSPAAGATPAAAAFTAAQRAVYQYSIPVTAIYSSRAADPMRRAYLWVPPGVTRLQGVMVGLHNMLEKPMFEDPVIRQGCAAAGIGIVFISPGDAKTWTPTGVGNYAPGLPTTALDLDPNGYGATDINPATGVAFASASDQAAAELAEVLRRLGAESGYSELQYAPILLAGHSAASGFVWTRAVHTSALLAPRVFAILPYKGTWGSAPAGVPVFHVSSEWQEISSWGNTWEVGDASSARALRGGGADRLVSEFVQPGTGHYQYSDTQSGPIATFIKRAAQLRIPADWPRTASPVLNTLAPTDGWLVDVTTLGSGQAAPVSYASWVGAGRDPLRAYWYLDQQTAQAACDAMNAGFAKKPQLISAFSNVSTLPNLANQSNGAGVVVHSATLQPDGVTFQLRTASLNQSPIPKLLYGAPVGIAGGPIRLKANGSGALKQTGPNSFRVWLDRGSVIKTGQPWEPFVIAWHPGDASYREADRPIQLNTSVPVYLGSFSGGATQALTFAAIPNQSADALPVLSLDALSSAGTSYPVQYWMVSGPYRNDEADSGILVPDTVPAGATFPLRVIVGAWQWGKPGVTQSAEPAYRTFWIFKDRFQKWQFEQFGNYNVDGVPVIPVGASDAAANPSGDGVSNLLKYAIGRSPSAVSTTPPAAVGSDGGRLQLSFQRIADPSLTYVVEATGDLGATWTAIWNSTGSANIAGAVTVSDSQLLSASPRRFLRLRVTR